MIQTIKHFAFRVWMTLFLGGLLSLALLSTWAPVALDWLIVPAAAVFGLIFMLLGWISSRLGNYQVERLQSEAAAWERAGQPQEAQGTFKRALALCDSFLFSPRSKVKIAGPLIAHMARFYLMQPDKNQAGEALILTYLKTHPGDSEFAENWLQQIDRRQLFEKEYQDVAERIGSALPDHAAIQRLLAKLYLSARRTDFPAQQVYRRASSGTGAAAADITRSLAVAFLEEGRADERALDIYLKAFAAERANRKLLKGIAACVHWVPQTEKTTNLLGQARKILTGIGEAELRVMRAGFIPPAAAIPTSPNRTAFDSFMHAGAECYRTAAFLWNRLSSIIRGSIRTGSRIKAAVESSREIRRLMKWSLVGLFGIAMIVLMINTIDHFFKTDVAERVQEQTLEAVVTDPFTLQVAAYLKPEHARQYVAALKKLNIDAYWTEAAGKNKNWYQVRVSHFPDKKSAIAYGEDLKSKGIINDFYVANY